MKRPLLLRALAPHRGLTLVEMLIAMSITLLMMAAVVTVFANVSGSINRRRATIEMAGELRNAREMLSRDLENATCPTLPPRRPEANEGYLEILEGPQNDFYPSVWLYDTPDDDNGFPEGVGSGSEEVRPRIDLQISSLPGSNLRGASITGDEEGRGVAIGSSGAESAADELPESAPTDGRGLGDADDVLMLTVRNENQPFVGRVPNRSGDFNPSTGALFPDWDFEELESPLAEVVWFAVENPPERDDQRTFAFGEAGYRTIYRRALLIAPWLEYRISVGTEVTGPGVVRVLNLTSDQVAQAIASLIAFQERYDLSVRLEWDPLLGSSSGNAGRWVLKANSLADLTKRENRYEHHGLILAPAGLTRSFPFPAVSAGRGYAGGDDVVFVLDPDYAVMNNADFQTVVNNDRVVAYEADPGATADEILNENRRYPLRPFAYVNLETSIAATARAVLNEDGSVVRVVRGMAPLSGDRRGDDVVLTDVMAFDLKAYDPGAPVYGYYPDGDLEERADVLVDPNDPAWVLAYYRDAFNDLPANGQPATSSANPFRYERQGAYVDLGYGLSFIDASVDPGRVADQFARVLVPAWTGSSPLLTPLFSAPGWLPTPSQVDLAPEFSVYDTWSWHYENNGLDEDNRDGDGDVGTGADEGTNGFDDPDPKLGGDIRFLDDAADVPIAGVDDPGERETRPPYQAALRGLQATLRVYERDSLQIRETKVRESFVPE